MDLVIPVSAGQSETCVTLRPHVPVGADSSAICREAAANRNARDVRQTASSFIASKLAPTEGVAHTDLVGVSLLAICRAAAAKPDRAGCQANRVIVHRQQAGSYRVRGAHRPCGSELARDLPRSGSKTGPRGMSGKPRHRSSPQAGSHEISVTATCSPTHSPTPC